MRTFEMKVLEKFFSPNAAHYYGRNISVGWHMLLGTWVMMYAFMYGHHDWTRIGGWHFYTSKPSIHPGHPDWPEGKSLHKEFDDYADYGLKVTDKNIKSSYPKDLPDDHLYT